MKEKKISLLKELKKISRTKSNRYAEHKVLKKMFPSYEALSAKSLSEFCEKFGFETKPYAFGLPGKPYLIKKLEILRLSLSLADVDFTRSIKEQYHNGYLELPQSKIYYITPILRRPKQGRPHWEDDYNGILLFEYNEDCYLFVHDFKFIDYYSSLVRRFKRIFKYQNRSWSGRGCLGKYPFVMRGTSWSSYQKRFDVFAGELMKV